MDRRVWIRALCLAMMISGLTACATRNTGDDFVNVDRYEAAADLFIEQAEKGDLAKMLTLASMYSSGKIDYRRDYVKAVYWYQKAAALGNVPSMYELGIIYEYGAGDVAPDTARAVHWYREGAERGDAYCQYRLGRVLSEDKAADPVDAYQWFLVAEASAAQCQDNVKCRIILDDKFNYKWELEKRLTDAQKTQGRERARSWQAAVAQSR